MHFNDAMLRYQRQRRAFFDSHSRIMTNQNKRLPELPPLTNHGLPDEIHNDRSPLDRVDRPIQPDKCPVLFKLH
jgi:hypothetical protein